MRKGLKRCFLLSALILLYCPFHLSAQAGSAASGGQAAQVAGQHDFDFEDGTWKIHLKRRLHPLTGSNSWVEFDGDTTTRQIWNGKAHLEQFETDGPAGHVEGTTLRLFNPQSQQWSIYWANSKDGALGPPMVGVFKNGVGEFFDQESYNGKMIYVRFIWSKMDTNSPHFEQSFSDDGGKTWEVNWITDQTRVQDENASIVIPAISTNTENGQHDFDFEFGTWNAHLRRLLHPLTGSNTWVEYDGVSTVQKIWNGRANLGEFDVNGSAGHIEGLSLRLYNPQSQQWDISWAGVGDGSLSAPMIGQFKNGRGEFYDQELFQGKAVLVRFIFSDITANSFHLEQAFSADGGKTWEPNWIVNFTRKNS